MDSGRRLNDFQFALHRPETFLGSIRILPHERWCWSEEKKLMQFGTLEFPEGLERIFYEIVSNAVDNYFRSSVSGVPMRSVNVSIDRETGYCTVWNDGAHIPVEKKEYSYTDELGNTSSSLLYPAELFFGYSKASTNYNDEEVRKTSGRNGLGAKLTSIFSKHFIVRCFDPENQRIFEQEFFDNLTRRSPPVIEKCTKKKGWTEVRFLPDFARFGLDGWTEPLLSRFQKTLRDASLVTGLSASFNGEKFSFPSLSDYVALFSGENPNVLCLSSPDSRFALLEKNLQEVSADSSQETSLSFVNGLEVFTGVHVNAWKSAVLMPLLKAFNAKQKADGKPKASMKQLECFFHLFVVCDLDKPEFTSQTKHELASPVPKTMKISPEQTKKLMKWGFVQELSSRLDPKKTKKTKKLQLDLTKVDDAQLAGTARSAECILILTEGDSAKTLAVSGFTSLKDRERYGAFALKGKVLNTTNATQKMIGKNKELELLRNVLGLSKDLQKTLRYGKVYLMCDADMDGSHIEGLVLNFFHKHHPELLQNGFVQSLRTPILKAFLGKKEEWFFSTTKFEEWLVKNPGHKNLKVQYFKGLGSSRPEDGRKYLSDQKLVSYVSDGTENTWFDLAFSKNKSNERKTWLAGPLTPDETYEGELTLSEFIDKRLSTYHRANNRRSIPSVYDGLKPSQRKVLYACFSSNIIGKNKKKHVDRLTGEVASVAGYHHGEESLTNTIIGMAQDFVGCGNNVRLLFPDGSFGTRLRGGKDHAASRYLSSYLEKVTRIVFPPEDDDLYERVFEDNEYNEPINYIPIIPLIVVNGACGIGTGHSTEIPPHNPLEVCQWIRCWLDEQETPKLSPWWKGFNGTMEVEEGKVKTFGVLEKMSKTKWKIVETPVGLWTYDCKKHLENLESQKHIKSFEDKYTDEKASFVINTTKDFIPTVKNLKLSSTFSLRNMTALDEKDNPIKFATVDDILHKYCPARLELYQKRKDKILADLSQEILKQANKQRFLQDVLSGALDMKMQEEILLQNMEEMGYDKWKDSYDYLVSMPIRTLTKGRLREVGEILRKLKEKHAELTERTPKEMWKGELDVFEKKYKRDF
ncbi:DNA topoisomerase II [Tokyovirus A1]|uniref:DNA topoisomerase II n=1 Tax=Tokyovirus A1 TaxID=1826170 RepID=UPI0007A95E18|nr:DNA topoisomerase II [Tokyovirus A1]BAU80081.1 DNA topoisomerase II [Tokyovirus A1]